MNMFWLGPPDDDDENEELPMSQPPPMRRAPCAFCNGKGWYWELITSSRSLR